VVALRGVGRTARYLALTFAVMCTALAVLSGNASAQTACPTASDDGNNTIMPAVVGSTLPTCNANIVGDATYDNFDSITYDSTFRFISTFPDRQPRPAVANPVKIIFLPSGGASRSPITSVNCGGGTITGVNTTLVTVSLAAGTSCALTVISPNGAGGTLMSYTATLSLDNPATTYSVSAGTLTGDIFGGTVALPLTTTQAVATTTLSVGTAAAPFTPVTASGGTAPLSFAVSPTLPAGLAFNTSTGQITGTPTAASAATTYTVTVTDAAAQTSSKTFSLTVTGAGTGLVLTTAASPSMFFRVGQAITFTYTVSNSFNLTVTGLSVADTKVSPIACAATTLAPGANTTCTGTYTTTAADVNATSIVSSATARGTMAGNTVTSAVVTTTVKIDAEAVRRATKSAIQSFLSQRANMITSMGPDMSRLQSRLTGSLFGGATDPSSDPNAPSGLGGPREDEARAQRPTMAMATPGFAAAGSGVRDSLASDRDALMRETASGDAGRPAISPFGFSGAADDGAGRFAFATSLTQMRTAAAAEQAQKEAAASGLADGLMGLGARGPARPTAAPPPRFDVWTEGAFSYYSQDRIDGKRQGHAGIFFAGADYVVVPGLLVGALVQVDWMDQTTPTLLQSANGQGWMSGPYVSARLTRNLFFDARALWGRSSNDINPLGAYVDSFETSRSLAAAKLTGRWAFGALSFQPSAEVIYFTERQEAYTNAIGIAIDNQSVSLGRLTFGPEVSYRLAGGGGSVIEPFVGLKGVWDFAKTNETTAAGEPVGHDAWRGRIETGATFRTTSGLSLRALGSYDGIGDSQFHAWQGRATLVVPLQ